MYFTSFRKNLLLATLTPVLSLGAKSQILAAPAFTDESVVLVTSAAVQAVVPIAGGYRMYFTRGGFQVLSATSTDQRAWGLESGVRLSTGSSADLDASSITSCGILSSANPAFSLRMFYIGISAAGKYSILSATSTNGLNWFKESGARLQVSGGSRMLDSPQPLPVAGGTLRLFYVADSSGASNPANYRIFSASSSDEGLTLFPEGQVLTSQAFQVSITTLTNGSTRLYYSSVVGVSSTPTQILSAISTNGLLFTEESGVRLSTNASNAALTYPVVVRSTESFRWRMFSSYTPAGSSTPYAASALTLFPEPTSLDPKTMLKSQTSAAFTLTGEMFSPSPAVTFTIGSDTMTAFSVTRVDDTRITGVINPFGKSLGHWDAVVTNSDSRAGTLAKALLIEIAPGSVSILDNLFRPLKGETAKITATVFGPGRLTLKLYTIQGGSVATLFDQDVPEGSHVVTWNGTTALGNTVASGVYLLKANGPKLDTIEKIVVIK